MSTDPNRHDIETFKVEAERLLASLEDAGTHPQSNFRRSQEDLTIKSPDANPRSDPGKFIAQSSVKPSSNNPGILPLLLVACIAAGIGFMLHLNYTKPSLTSVSETEPIESLQFQETCGSNTDSSIHEWWPVLGPADSHVLEVVRKSYCGDAYINSNGYVQVASFHSPEEAARLSRLLSRLTGFAFRMGERYQPALVSQIQKSAEPDKQIQPSSTPNNVPEGLITDSIQTVERLYEALSSKDFGAASHLYSDSASNQFDPNFYGQFERVFVDQFKVINTDSSITTLAGIVHFYYVDGSVQTETRQFTLDNSGATPIVISSSFGRVLKSR
jgi:hypothetical protein